MDSVAIQILFDWQSRNMRCRHFMFIAICDVTRSRSAQGLSFVGSARTTVAPIPGAFRLFPITNRDNRSFYVL